jgi:hypothetical protein
MFLRSAKPKTLAEIKGDEALRYLRSKSRHRACIVGDQESSTCRGSRRPEDAEKVGAPIWRPSCLTWLYP